MPIRLFIRLFLSYGAALRSGKPLALILLLLATPLSAEPPTVLAFGDSLTHGYGLPRDQGFVPQLQRWLQGQGAEVTLIHAGVSGDTTAGGLARLDWSLSPAVDAMILALGGNDLLRGLDPSVSRANLDGMLQIASDRGIAVLLVGMQAPANYGADYQAQFDAIYPELSAQYETLYLPSFFAGLQQVETADLPRYFQSDRIHPNAAGVAKVVEGIGPKVLQLIEGLD